MAVKDFKLTILAENKAGGKGLLAEHGLAFLLECEGEKLLFDTGQGLVLEHNLRKLQLRLDQCKVVLSHGHYDHTGGLLQLTEEFGPLQVYAHPDLFTKRYTKEKDGSLRECGLPFAKADLEEAGCQFFLSREPQEIIPGVIVSGEIPRIHKVEHPHFLSEAEGGLEEDPLLDDQFLLIHTERGYVLVLGCTHSGLANTLAYAQKLIGQEKIWAVIGGLHLVEAKEELIQENIELLKEIDAQYLIPLHCTGFRATSLIACTFRERCLEGKVGSRIEFGKLVGS